MLKKTAAKLLFLVCMVGCIALVALPTAPAATGSASDLDRVDAFVRSQMSDAHLPGLGLAIVHGDQIAHVAGFGTSVGTSTPITKQTPFIIGSVSKSFTALAVMQLVEAGMVDLDTPAHVYLPGFRLADQADSDRISVRQLLNQTSGIPTEAGIGPLTAPVTSLDAQVRRLDQVKPQSAPGAAYAYSNANYEVLGRLVELVSGQDYGTYIHDRVLLPLDMQHTFTSLGAAKVAGLTGACDLWFGLAQCEAPGAGFRPDFVPAGFLISTAEDMGHYLVAQLNGGRYGSSTVLSQSGIDLLHRRAVSAGLSAGGGGYGMGWIAGPRAKFTHTVWHDGSAAGFHSMVLMLPATGWGVAILVNAESLLYTMLGRLDVIADGIAALLLSAPTPGTLAGLYVGFNLAVILIILLQVRSLVRLWRRPSGLPAGRGPLRLVLFELVIPVWRELLAPFALAIGVPAALGAPWLNLVHTDVGAFLLSLAALLLLTGMVRIYRMHPVVWRMKARLHTPQPARDLSACVESELC